MKDFSPTAPCAAPGAASSLHSPALGAPPDPQPGQTPHPGPDSAPRGSIPVTDGTPAPCRQKNAAEFLAGRSPGVMDFYAPELFAQMQPDTRRPAPDAPEAVRRLERWREQAPYG